MKLLPKLPFRLPSLSYLLSPSPSTPGFLPNRQPQESNEDEWLDEGQPPQQQRSDGTPGPTPRQRAPFPSELSPNQYSTSAFETQITRSGVSFSLGGLEKLRASQMPAAISNPSDRGQIMRAPLEARLRALQQGLVGGDGLVLLGVDGYKELVAAWDGEDERAAVAHVTGAWQHLTEEQVRGGEGGVSARDAGQGQRGGRSLVGTMMQCKPHPRFA